jgi:hypothetical protein
MSVSKPLQLVSLRLTPQEKRNLAQLAADQHVTLSHALREGARLYLEDLEAGRRKPVAEPYARPPVS